MSTSPNTLLPIKSSKAPTRSRDAISNHQMLVEWNATRSEYPRTATIPELFAIQARKRSEAEAILCAGTSWSYRLLNERANQLAHELRARGVGPETMVGLLMERRPERIMALLAILKAGGVYVPLEPSYPADRLSFILEDSRAELVLGEHSLANLLPPSRAEWLSVDEIDLRARPITDPPLRALPEHLAYVSYTSGSTGRPKGVAVNHRGVVRLLFATDYCSFGPEETFLHMAPIAFDASTFEIWGALLHGGRLRLYSPGKVLVGELAQLLEGGEVTTIFLTTGLFHQLVEQAPQALRCLEQLITGGDVMSVPHVRQAMHEMAGRSLIIAYGPTESTTYTTCLPRPDEAALTRSVPLGRPIKNTRVNVLSASLSPMAPEDIGELFIAGDGLARGYLGQGALTAERFIPDPFAEEPGGRLYRTGDLASYRGDGLLLFHGRQDDQVKIRGFRIELGEIESALNGHPGIASATVVAREERPGDKVLVAYVVREGAQHVVVSELRAYLAECLPEFMVPATFVFLARMPLTANGKIDRRALPAPGRERPELATAFSAPQGELEERLATVWGELLGLDDLGRDDDFLELGGHSLLISRLSAQISTAFGVKLSLRDLYVEPTIAGQARCIAHLETTVVASDDDHIPPAPRDQPLPLSFPQERIWLLSQMSPDNAAYHAQATIRFRGRFRIAVFARVLDEIVRRHEIFRTSFPVEDGQPIQLIHPPCPVELPVIDLAALPTAIAERLAERLMREEFTRPFELLTPPLARWKILRFNERDHMLLQAEHHLVHDGWSIAMLLREMKELYVAFRQGKSSPLPEPAIQFVDFAFWQRQRMRGELLDEHLRFWTARLQGCAQSLDVPSDRPRPKAHSFKGRLLRFELERELCQQLRAFGRRRGVTLFNSMLSVFKALLFRYTGQKDLLVGTGVANRNRQQLEDMLGMVVNTLILRTKLAAGQRFSGLLARIHEDTLAAYAYQDMPLDKLVEKLAPERDPSRNPLFQTMFSFHDSPMPDMELSEPGGDELYGEVVHRHSDSAKFDLTVVSIPRAEQRVGRQPKSDDESIEMLWEYSTDLFDETTVRRMAAHYASLLRGALDDPDQRLLDLPLLLPGEHQQLCHESNDVVRQLVGPETLYERLVAAAERSPEAVSVTFAEEHLTYGELITSASWLASRLRDLGVGPDVLVGLAVNRTLEVVPGLVAVLAAGGAYVPLDASYPEKRLAYMIETLFATAPRGVLVTQRAVVSALPALPRLSLIELEELRGPRESHLDATVPRLPACTAEHLAYTLFTSGSTGQPKAVMIPQRAIVNHMIWMQRTSPLTADDTVLQKTPMSFDASVWEFFAPLLAGARLVMADPEAHRDPALLAGELASQRVTILQGVPTLLGLLIPELERFPGLALRRLYAGGEALSRSLVARLRPFARQIFNLYGPTEATIDATMHLCSDARSLGPPTSLQMSRARPHPLTPTPWPERGDKKGRGHGQTLLAPPSPARERGAGGVRSSGRRRLVGLRRSLVSFDSGTFENDTVENGVVERGTVESGTVPLGPPIDNTRIHLLDCAGQPVPFGVAAEIVIGGLGLARGYFGRPGETAARFVPDPFGADPGSRLYRTGDLARRSTAGELLYLGRLDQQVKIHGVRVELEEIEAQLRQHPRLQEAAVTISAGEDHDGRLVAHVVPREESELDPNDLRAFLARHLPQRMVPTIFLPTTTLPLTPSGKIDRRALTQRSLTDRAQSTTGRGPQAARNPVEELLIGLWQQLLGVETIGTDDDFFALGGHSLLAIRMMAKIRQLFAVELPLPTLFAGPTITELAAAIAERLATDDTPRALPLIPVERREDLPLSHAQESLWLIDQLEPGNPMYLLPVVLRLRGRLDTRALTAALAAIERRHEVLRSRFPAQEGQPVQRILAPRADFLRQVELGVIAAAEREEITSRLILDEACRPFALHRDPPWRTLLLHLDGERQLLVLTLHHIAADGWSIGVLLRDLRELYSAFHAEQHPQLAPLSIQVADHAVWQRRQLKLSWLEQQTALWRSQLGDNPGILELPWDRPRPSRQSHRGAFTTFALDPELRQALETLGQQHGATLFMTLLAAFKALLHRYTARRDIAVGTPIAGRQQIETEKLIGYFVNTLVLRSELDPHQHFSALLERLRQTTLAAYALQDLPFEKLVALLRPERSLGHNPLFQVMFASEQETVAEAPWPELEVAVELFHNRTAKFDLTLTLMRGEDRFWGTIEYAVDLFDPSTIARFSAHLQTLLTALATAPDTPVGVLPLISAGERAQLLGDWNDTRVESGDPTVLHELFALQARERGAALAVVEDARQLSYGELARRVGALARRLRGLGVGAESRVALLAERSLEMVIGMLAILEAGGAYVPLDPRAPEDRLSFMMADAEARVLVVHEPLLASWATPPSMPTLFLDAAAPISATSSAGPEIPLAGDHPAYMIYTSGSTGQPKGVLISHRAAVNYVLTLITECGLTATDRVLQFASPSFDTSVEEIYPTLSVGATLVLRNDPMLATMDDFCATMTRWRITLLDLPTAFWHELCQAFADTELALPTSIRLTIIAGEAARSTSLAAWRRRAPRAVSLLNTYGPTEATIAATWAELSGDPAATPRSVPIGRPIRNLTALVTSPTLRLQPIGVAGELCLAGRGLARGYHRRPAQTAERYIPHPWSDRPGARLYRTGDRTRWLSDGTLELHGRLDDQIKIRGFRVELGEIEAALLSAGAAQAAVVWRDTLTRRQLVAFWVAAPSITTSELRQALGRALPEYMVPGVFVELEALPLLTSGKIDRRALLRAELPAASDGSESLATGWRGPIEEVVAGIWREVLGGEVITPCSHFFALGGHSLLAIQILTRLQRAFAVELSLASLFEHPTVRQLAEVIEGALKNAEKDELPPLLPAPRDQGELPLSFAQEQLWFLDQLEPGNPVYHMPALLRLDGPLRTAELAASLRAICHRHEALRTVFPAAGGHPVQKIASSAPMPLPVVELGALSLADQERQLTRLVEAEARHPFDLANGPLWRATLLRHSHLQHVLLLTLHHIIADGWSLTVLTRELAELYRAAVHGRRPDLPRLAVQYADFARWQRDFLQGEAHAEKLAFWRRHLAGEETKIELPTDRPRPSQQSHRGDFIAFKLEPALAEHLERLGHAQGATLFITLLTAFKTLLLRLTGQSQITVGTTTAGREQLETEDLIGFFVNTLALRSRLDSRITFGEQLARLRTEILRAFAHQDLPFDQVVADLAPERSLSHNPLFQVMFAVEHEIPPQRALEDVELRFEMPHNRSAKFDLTCALTRTPDGLRGAIEYATDLFDRTTIARLIRQWRTLLAGIVEEPRSALAALPLLPAAQRAQLLAEWNDSDAAKLAVSAGLHQLCETQAAMRSDALAVAWADGALSRGELERRANRLAHRLIDHGVASESRVAIACERSGEMVIAILAVLKSGAAYVPLDPLAPRRRRSLIIDDANVVLLLCDQNNQDLSPSTEALPMLVLSRHGRELAPGVATPPEVAILPEHPAYMIYTSGSTGRPKGVLVSHRAATAYVQSSVQDFAIKTDDRLLQFASISFDVSVEEIFCALAGGALLVLRDDAMLSTLEDFLDTVQRWRITLLDLTTTFWHELCRTLDQDGLPLPSAIRLIIIGGEAALPAQLNAWHRRVPPTVRLLNCYGPTETTVAVTSAELGTRAPALSQPTVTIGRPLPNMRAYVADRALHLVPTGVAGELCLAGIGLARGYFRHAAQTAARFIPNPWAAKPGERLYRTGDLVRWLADGRLEFHGRRDDQVKIRGFRVELGEVESSLRHLPRIRETAVLTRNDQNGVRLVAFIVPPSALEASMLGELLAGTLPPYMVPTLWIPLDELPKLPSGKLDRAALERIADKDGALLGHRALSDQERPLGPIEELVAQIFSEVLACGPLGPEGDFFALGGHSLLATQAVARLRARFAIELTLRHLFTRPKVADLAALIAGERQGGSTVTLPPLVTLDDRQGLLALSFAQERLWFLDQLESQSAAYNIPLAWRLRGRLDAKALDAALDHIARRHEILRTTYQAVDGAGFQVIQIWEATAILVVDLSALEPGVRERALEHLGHDEGHRPFELDRDRALRKILLRLDDDEHVLLLTLHHIAGDGASVDVLTRELAVLYNALLAGGEPNLAELPVQYADFAAWQRRYLSGEVLADQLSFWRRQLKGAPPLLELPTDRPRPALLSDRGASVTCQLPVELVEGIKGLARQHGATPFMVLLSAFQAQLYHLSGQRDVVAGAPISGRQQVETEPLIGFFLNNLVLRTRIEPRKTFAGLVDQVAERVLDAYLYQDLPFEKLVEELEPQRSLSHHPLYQVMLNLHAPLSGRQEEPILDGLTVERLQLDESLAKLDLNVHALDRGADGMLMSWVYSVDLFDPTSIERLTRHFARLLESAVEHPERPVAELELFAPSERQQMMHEWNDTWQSRTGTLHQLVARQVALTPDRIALVHGDRASTYGDLERRSRHLAHQLWELGAGPEARLAVLGDRSLETVTTILAVLEAGAAYVALDPHLPPARLTFMLKDCQAELLLTRTSDHSVATGFSGPVLDVEPFFERDPDGLPASEVSRRAEHDRVSPYGLAYVVYTSGTTGKPKGVMGHHHGAVSYLGFLLRIAPLRPGTRTLQLASLGFDASVRELFAPFAAGATVVLPRKEERQDLAALLDLLTEQRVRALFSIVPSLLRAFCEAAARRPPKTTFLDTMLTSGERLLARDARQVWEHLGPKITLINQYGPTEGTMVSSFHRLLPEASSALSDRVPVGRPKDACRFYILNREFAVCPLGAIGEIHFGGPSLTRGYFARPRETAARFVPDPFGLEDGGRLYATGDLGRFLASGKLDFIGRGDHQIKVLGNRVEPGEIEVALCRHPAVDNAVVTAWETAPGEMRLTAHLACHDSDQPTTEELRAHLRSLLPEYMVPTAWTFLDRLPTNPNGKIDRAALAQSTARGLTTGDDATYSAPRTQVGKLLAAIWCELLGIERVASNDNFFDLGGHSLHGLRVLYRLQELLGVKLEARVLFAAQTLVELAVVVEEELIAQLEAMDEAEARRERASQGTEQTGTGRAGFLVSSDLETEAAALPAPLATRLRRLSPTHRELRGLRLANAQDQGLPEQHIPRQAPGQSAPLAWMQETFWFIDQQEQSTSAYLNSQVLTLRGQLDLRALHQAFDAMVARHEILRTCFATDEEGRLCQLVAPELRLDLPVVDISSLTQEGHSAQIDRVLMAVHQPFDLSRVPLVRLLVVRQDASRHVLAVMMHHILTDDWSMGGIFFQELTELYDAALNARPPRLEELPIQYADYASWERQRLPEDELAVHLRHWEEKLAGGLPQLALRTDRPRPAVPRYRGASTAFRLSRELTQDLEAVSRATGVSLFMTLLTGYKILLARRADQHDILVASPTAQRALRQAEKLVGCFLNMLLLRTDLGGNPTLREATERVKETVLHAFSQAETPFMVLLANFPPPDFAFDRSPFQAFFTLLNAPESGLSWPGLEVESWGSFNHGATDQDLALWMSHQEELGGILVYDADLFSEATIKTLIEDFRAILAAICSAPDKRLSELA